MEFLDAREKLGRTRAERDDALGSPATIRGSRSFKFAEGHGTPYRKLEKQITLHPGDTFENLNS